MDRRRARRATGLVIAALLACAALAPGACRRSTPPERIVLVVIDTLRRDRVAAYGGQVPTPNLDSFAAGGSVFTRVVGAFNLTTMSMGALFTGRTPSIESGRPDQPLPWTGHTWCGLARLAETHADPCLPPAVPTLAEHLRAAGYHTAGVVSNLLLFRPAGFDRGFDHWAEVGPNAAQTRQAQSGQVIVYDPALQAGDHVNRAVEAWLARRPGDRFFLYVHYMDAHDWLQAKVPYDEGVRRADRHLGALRRALANAGLLEGSVVVITSDHGESLRERHVHEALPTHMGNPAFEPVLAVPLIVWPRQDADPERPMRSDDTFRLIRTIAGLDRSAPPDLEPDELFLSERLFRTYRRGRWKSIWDRGQNRPLLLDLERDPAEQRNAAAEHPDVVAEHRRRIDELSARLAGEASATAPSPLDAERLRALGYAE